MGILNAKKKKKQASSLKLTFCFSKEKRSVLLKGKEMKKNPKYKINRNIQNICCQPQQSIREKFKKKFKKKE